jgi:hypothetical protein
MIGLSVKAMSQPQFNSGDSFHRFDYSGEYGSIGAGSHLAVRRCLQHYSRSIPQKQFTITHIPAEHRIAGVTCLRADFHC